MTTAVRLLAAALFLPAAALAQEPAQRLLNLLQKKAEQIAAPPAPPPAPAPGAAPGQAAPTPAPAQATTSPSPAAAALATATATATSPRPDARYTVSADGHEVTDTTTGLIWRRCAEGMRFSGATCTGEALLQTSLVRALDHAKRQGGAWRLPSYDELKALARLHPAPGASAGIMGIDAAAFPATPQRNFWSSTLYNQGARGDRDRTKVIYFAGFSSQADLFLDNGENGMMRLVRSGGDAHAGAVAAGTTALPAALPPPPPGPRFVVSGGGREVTDQHTGLVWRRCAEGMNAAGNACSGSPLAVDHAGAVARAQSQAKASGQPWRLPDADELKSIADEKRFGLAIDTAIFPGTPPQHFWTSFKESEDYAKAVHFYNGFLYGRYHTNPHHVRLVRGGEPKTVPTLR